MRHGLAMSRDVVSRKNGQNHSRGEWNVQWGWGVKGHDFFGDNYFGDGQEIRDKDLV